MLLHFSGFKCFIMDMKYITKANSLYQGDRDCLWRDCGFCSVEGPEELRRHLFFHCYHTKLKQFGQQVLNAQPDIGTCSIGYPNCNIVPEIPENFVCLWKECEVSQAGTAEYAQCAVKKAKKAHPIHRP